jgi:hypothetical protein
MADADQFGSGVWSARNRRRYQPSDHRIGRAIPPSFSTNALAPGYTAFRRSYRTAPAAAWRRAQTQRLISPSASSRVIPLRFSSSMAARSRYPSRSLCSMSSGNCIISHASVGQVEPATTENTTILLRYRTLCGYIRCQSCGPRGEPYRTLPKQSIAVRMVVCLNCQHMAPLPVRDLVRRYGDLFPVEMALSGPEAGGASARLTFRQICGGQKSFARHSRVHDLARSTGIARKSLRVSGAGRCRW